MKKNIFYNKIIAIFFIICVVFLPNAFLLPSQISQLAIVTALGIDKVDNQIQLSAQTIVPKFETGFTKNTTLVFSSQTSLINALEQMELNLGKPLAFAHLNSIVISDSLLNSENLNIFLEPLYNHYSINQNAMVLFTLESAKTLLEVLSENTPQKIELSALAQFNNNTPFDKTSTLKNIALQNNNSSAIVMPVIEIIEENLEVQSLQNNSQVTLFKNGIKTAVFEKSEWENVLFFTNPNNLTFSMDTNGEEVNDGEIKIRILNSQISKKTSFKNNIPRLFLNSNLTVNIDTQNPLQEINFNKELQKNIVNIIRRKLVRGFLLLKEQNIDVLSFYDTFYAYQNKEFKKYLNGLENNENYLQKLELFAKIIVNIKHKITLAY